MKIRTYEGILNKLPKNSIFVFGSNTQGRHGLGAAKTAREKFGAIYGQPKGLQGNSYAIVTKDLTKKIHPSISKDYIINQINSLYDFAVDNIELDFYIAYCGVGKNLNSYTPMEMAEMFSSSDIPDNIIFEKSFSILIKKALNII